MTKLIPIILSGGSGTRLWPVSREASPKPFIILPDGESLLQKAFTRAAKLPDVSAMIVVTRTDLFWRSEDHFKASGVPGVQVDYLLEPFGRNTAGAITIATSFAQQKYGGDIALLVLSADHLINDQDSFATDVTEARLLARSGFLVTFGIPPTHPETAYGYIEQGGPIARSQGLRVERFAEKPDRETAERFIESGRYLWNAGIFCFTPKTFLAECESLAPDVFLATNTCLSATDTTQFPITLDSITFEQLQNISIDHALMEHSSRVAVVPAHFDWKDIGSWDAMAKLTESDEHGNRTVGEVFAMATKNSYIHSPNRFTTTIGVEDLIIVDTPDALLVAHKDHTQEVKKITEHLKSNGKEEYLYHRTVHRPWGTYTILEEGVGFKIKRITVKPGATLSLQSHVHRSEHWVVIHGKAKIVNGEEEIHLETNESTFVKAGNKHRLANPHGSEELAIIETQVGVYLGEDDIERFDDRYGRK